MICIVLVPYTKKAINFKKCKYFKKNIKGTNGQKHENNQKFALSCIRAFAPFIVVYKIYSKTYVSLNIFTFFVPNYFFN